MNLAAWAECNGVARVTGYRWFHAVVLPVPARKVGRLILVEPASGTGTVTRTAVYARVSSADQKADLDRQVARVTAWATAQQIPVGKVVVEVGSVLNGHRRKFLALLRDHPPRTKSALRVRDLSTLPVARQLSMCLGSSVIAYSPTRNRKRPETASGH
jgi:predicted site-specific integrase-resolvase